jgi:hypothetical protein
MDAKALANEAMTTRWMLRETMQRLAELKQQRVEKRRGAQGEVVSTPRHLTYRADRRYDACGRAVQ